MLKTVCIPYISGMYYVILTGANRPLRGIYELGCVVRTDRRICGSYCHGQPGKHRRVVANYGRSLGDDEPCTTMK